MIKKIIYIALLLFYSVNIFAQNNKVVDSLLIRLGHTTTDSAKANIYKELCWELRNDNITSANDYGLKALTIYVQQKNILGQCDVLNKLGIVKRNSGEYSKAMEYFFKVFSTAQQPLCNKEIAYSNNNICDIYMRLEEYDKALEFVEKADKLFRLLGDKAGLAYVFNQKGLIYENLKKWTQALVNFKQSLDMRINLRQPDAIAVSLQNIGDCYVELNQLDSAFKSYQKSSGLFAKYNNKSAYLGLGKYYISVKNYKLAVYYLIQSMEMAVAAKNPSLQQKAYEALQRAYYESHDFNKAYEIQSIVNTLKDSLQIKDLKKIITLEMNYQTEQHKKMEAIEAFNKKTVNDSIILKQHIVTGSLAVILLTILIFAYVIYRNYKHTKKANGTLLQNINELKKAEQQINKLSIAIEQSPTTIVITDIKGNVEYVNPKFTELTGYTVQEAIGTNPGMLKSGKTDVSVYKDLWQTITSGKIWTGEFINKKKNGDEFIESAIIAPIFDSNQNIINFISIKEDITARKQAERTIIHQNEQLAELNATKDKFFGIIAHDLKNPFNSILGFSELLISNIDSYEKELIVKFISAIYTSSKSAFKLLESLLEWSRAQSGNIEFDPANFKLENLVVDVIVLNENISKAKNISINYELSDNLTVFADRNMLYTILRNLLSNAIKFTNKNGNIRIIAALKNDVVEITVSDNGVGMSDENKNKLFKISEKLSTLGTDDEKGTGLGLLLCKEFVEKHNGKLWVESELNKGSHFKFTLPSSNG